MKEKLIKKTSVCFLTFFLGLAVLGYSQPGDPGGDPDVPISGIEILITLGGLLGVSRFFRKKKIK